MVWGVGYRLINDRVMNSPGLAFLPSHVARQWFTAFVQDEIALVAERLHVTLGTKVEHNDYTGFEIQPSGRVNWTLSPSGTLWAAISRAVRTPSRIDRELFVPAQPPYFLAGGPNFHSEEELAYEVGYRHQAGALSVSLATFYSRYHGLRSLEQDSAPAPTPLVIANGQDGESYGAELAAVTRRLHGSARPHLAQSRKYRYESRRDGIQRARSPVVRSIVRGLACPPQAGWGVPLSQ